MVYKWSGCKFTADQYAVYKWLGCKFSPSPRGEGFFCINIAFKGTLQITKRKPVSLDKGRLV